MFIEGRNEILKLESSKDGNDAKIKDHFNKFGSEWVERALKKGVNTSSMKLEMWLSTLASIGSVSPLCWFIGNCLGHY